VVHRERVAKFWDDHIRGWMSGQDPLPDPLPRWFASYAGKGRGAMTRDGFAEPHQGDLLGKAHQPRLVVLGLNPGGFVPAMQARDGAFAREIAHEYGGNYSGWAAWAPYMRDGWTTRYGRNKYVAGRMTFTGRWLGITHSVPNDLMGFELYPWHSTGLTGRMRPPTDVIDEFVWQPISEIDSEFAFGFGREWDAAASSLGCAVFATSARVARTTGLKFEAARYVCTPSPAGSTSSLSGTPVAPVRLGRRRPSGCAARPGPDQRQRRPWP
jgi:hypothetical protein